MGVCVIRWLPARKQRPSEPRIGSAETGNENDIRRNAFFEFVFEDLTDVLKFGI
jgi:hypothetical protein